jgi:hypothetical protein
MAGLMTAFPETMDCLTQPGFEELPTLYDNATMTVQELASALSNE